MCQEEETSIVADSTSPLGIVPAEWLLQLQQDAVYEDVRWSDGASLALEIRFGELSAVGSFVSAEAVGGTGTAACEDFVKFDVMLELSTVGDDRLDERIQVPARVYASERGRIDHRVPKEQIRGSLGSWSEVPGGPVFDGLAIQLAFRKDAVEELLITAESNAAHGLDEWLAAWP